MSQKKNVHLVPNPERGGWDAKRPNAERASKHFDTKAPGKEYSKNLAQKDKVEYIEHLKNGTIGTRNSYGNDPNPPKDKNR